MSLCGHCDGINMIILGTFLLALAFPVTRAAQSPCPQVLRYESKAPELPSRWYAQITFPPEITSWQRLTIDLDKKAHLLGNWVGDVSSKDNIKYYIDNRDSTTQDDPIRFFVKHDPDDEAPPRVLLITLDGQKICSAGKLVQPAPLQRPVVTTTERVVPVQQATVKTTERPVTINRPPHLVSITDDNEEPQCGTVKLNNPVALVVDGSPTLEGQWPWQVALYRVQGVNHNYICGGTLVSRRDVITAAHCTTVRNSRPAQKVDETSLIVYLGKHDLVTSIEGVQVRFVEKVTIFPEYDTRTLTRDLSVLLLHKPVQYTSWVQPACLWPEDMTKIDHILDERGSVVGWGNDGSGKLKLAQMPVVSQETCLRAKPDFYSRVTSDYTYCAGQRNGQSTCNGDSGGGMVFPINNVWYLRGVVSLAISKQDEAVCDPRYYVVFTDVAKYLPWIRENIEPY